MKRLFLLCFTCLFITGCWDRDEFEDRSTILGIAIDVAKEEEEPSPNHPKNGDIPTTELGLVKVTAQIAIPGKVPLNPGGGDSNPNDAVWIVESVGHTIGDAMYNLQQKLAHQIFLGHLKVIIISEEVAKKGIKGITEYLRRAPDVRRTAWIAVNGENAAKTMEAAPKMERVPTMYLASVFKEAMNMGKFPEHNLGLFWIATSDKGRDGFLPYISVKQGEHINISGVAYFNDEKMVGKTDPYQIAYFNGLVEHNPGGSSALFKIKEDQGVLFTSIKRKADYKFLLKDGKPSVHINFHLEGEIKEKVSESLRLDKAETIKEIEKVLNKLLEKEFRKLIKDFQQKGSDVLGFGENIRGNYPDYWDKHINTAEKWKEVYPNMDVSIKATSKILRTGLVAQ